MTQRTHMRNCSKRALGAHGSCNTPSGLWEVGKRHFLRFNAQQCQGRAWDSRHAHGSHAISPQSICTQASYASVCVLAAPRVSATVDLGIARSNR